MVWHGYVLPKGLKRLKYRSCMVSNYWYVIMLQRLDREELIKLLIEFKNGVVECARKGEVLDYPSRKLFTMIDKKRRDIFLYSEKVKNAKNQRDNSGV